MALVITGNKSTKLKGGTDYGSHLDEPVLKAPSAMAKIEKQKTYMGKPNGEVEQSEEKIHDGVIIPAHRLCQIHASGQHTVNLGNYESAKIMVGLTMPADKDDIDNAYDFAISWVSTRIEKEIKDSKN